MEPTPEQLKRWNSEIERVRRERAAAPSPGDEPPADKVSFEKFTDRARRVLQFADREARRLNHEYIGTEHLLLGLAGEGNGIAAQVLKNLGMDFATICWEVWKFVTPGKDTVVFGKPPRTPRADQTLRRAVAEAANLGHGYVGTEHILLGLLPPPDADPDNCGVAGKVLQQLGLTAEKVRAEIMALLHGAAPTGDDDVDKAFLAAVKDGWPKNVAAVEQIQSPSPVGGSISPGDDAQVTPIKDEQGKVVGRRERATNPAGGVCEMITFDHAVVPLGSMVTFVGPDTVRVSTPSVTHHPSGAFRKKEDESVDLDGALAALKAMKAGVGVTLPADKANEQYQWAYEGPHVPVSDSDRKRFESVLAAYEKARASYHNAVERTERNNRLVVEGVDDLKGGGQCVTFSVAGKVVDAVTVDRRTADSVAKLLADVKALPVPRAAPQYPIVRRVYQRVPGVWTLHLVTPGRRNFKFDVPEALARQILAVTEPAAQQQCAVQAPQAVIAEEPPAEEKKADEPKLPRGGWF